MPGLAEFHDLMAQADYHSKTAREIRERGLKLFAETQGLVPGKTRLRCDGVVGIFREVLAYQDGVVWVSVTGVSPPEVAGKRKHFYSAWEQIDEQDRPIVIIDNDEADVDDKPKIRFQIPILPRWAELTVGATLFYWVPTWYLFPCIVLYVFFRHEDELDYPAED